MNGPIVRGDDMAGLVRYLLGPGREEEHVNPRVIGAEASISVPVGVTPSREEIRSLGFQLDLPRRIHGTRVTRPVKLADGTKIQQPAHVWHLVLANPAADRVLEDSEWSAIAQDAVARMGFAGNERVAPCPWVAIRHGLSRNGNDHIHVAVSLVREDGRKASVHNDWTKIGAACRHYERQYGLTVVLGRKGGASHNLTPAEAQREAGRRATTPDSARETSVKERLERKVRAAATAAADEAEFVRRLRGDGLALRPRYGTGGRDEVVGYSVAFRGDNPIWHGGRTLSADLSLPKLRERWASEDASAGAVAEWRRDRRPTQDQSSFPEARRYASAEWQHAADHVSSVVDRLLSAPPNDEATWQALTADAAGVLGILAERVEGGSPGGLSRAARQLATAAHRPAGTPLSPGASENDLRGVAMVASQAALPGGAQAWASLLGQIGRLITSIAEAERARFEAGAAQALAAEAAMELDSLHQHYSALRARRHVMGVPLHVPLHNHAAPPQPIDQVPGQGMSP